MTPNNGAPPDGDRATREQSRQAVSAAGASVPSADWLDVVMGYEVAVRQLWRAVRGLNLCHHVRCADLESPNCVCNEEFQAQLAWARQEHIRMEGAQVIAARSGETQSGSTEGKSAVGNADAPDDEWGCDYCRNDGRLTDNNICPKCDAQYPETNR